MPNVKFYLLVSCQAEDKYYVLSIRFAISTQQKRNSEWVCMWVVEFETNVVFREASIKLIKLTNYTWKRDNSPNMPTSQKD